MRVSARVLVLLVAVTMATLAISNSASADAAADRQTLLDKGIAAKQKRDYDAAIADFDQAIAADPRWAVAYEFRGSVRAAKAEATDDPMVAEALLDRAIADYDMVVRLGAPTARTYTLRAIALSDNGNFKDAIGDLDRALKLDGNFVLATRVRANVVDQLHEQERTIAIDSDLLRFQPRNIDLLLSRAVLLAHAGRRDEARQDVAKVLEIDPKNEAALAQREFLDRTATKNQPAAKP